MRRLAVRVSLLLLALGVCTLRTGLDVATRGRCAPAVSPRPRPVCGGTASWRRCRRRERGAGSRPGLGNRLVRRIVPGSGRTVTIQVDGYAVSLTHLGEIATTKGASVAEGDDGRPRRPERRRRVAGPVRPSRHQGLGSRGRLRRSDDAAAAAGAGSSPRDGDPGAEPAPGPAPATDPEPLPVPASVVRGGAAPGDGSRGRRR